MTERRHQQRRMRLMSGLALATLMAVAPMVAHAQVAHHVHIAAGPLDAALQALAAQSHEQLLYPSAMVAGRKAPAVDGVFTTDEVLQRLLADTGLAARQTSPQVFVLRETGAVPRPVATAPEAQPTAGGARPFGGDASPTPFAPALPTAARATDATVSEIEVTGTHIRGAQSASPLVVLDRADIDRTGRATVAEAIEALPQNFSGIATEGTVTTLTDGVGRNSALGSGVNLRGLGADATLVLINGHRMAGAGSFGDFADLSSIATGAVSRVEVLLDGASAVYGSDAVGGVVNVILRKDFEGAETRLLAGSGTAGEPFQGQFSQLFGHRWSSGNILFSYEFQQRDALPSADRRFAATADLRPLGGTDQRSPLSFPGNILGTDPVTGGLVPRFAIPVGQNGVGLKPSDLEPGVVNLTNQHQGADILPRQALHAFYLAASQDLGDRLEVSADARFSHRIYSVRTPSPPTALNVTSANPFYVSPTGAPSELIEYSYIGDLPNPRQRGIADTLGLTLDGKLKLFGDWSADGYLAFAQEIETAHTSGNTNSLFVNEALGTIANNPLTPFSTSVNGFFNPFAGVPGSNSPAVLAFISQGFTALRTRDQVASANLQADGTVFDLPAGPLKMAVGVQGRRESLFKVGSSFTSTLTPTPLAVTDVARDVLAGYVEFRAPIFGAENRRPGFERLELSVAGRVERYSDVGSTANPQFGVTWLPVSDLSFRSTYGTSFRAPALRELHDPALNTSSQFPLGLARIRTLVLGGGNPDLKPETARSWTVGADWTPVRWPGLTLGLTWFDVRFRDRIDRPVLANETNALVDPTLTDFVTRLSPTTSATDLALISKLLALPASSAVAGAFPASAYGAVVDARYVNTTALHVRGLDLTGSYHFDVGDDRVVLGGQGSYMPDYEKQVTPTSAVLNLAGLANFPVKFRGRLTADWTHGRVTAGAAFNYVASYHDSLGIHIGDQPTMDLQLRVAAPDQGIWRGTAVTFNVRNVFDRDPPFYNNTAGFGYDPANADPIGRFASVQLTHAW